MTVEELLRKKKLSYKHSGGDFVISCLNPEHEDSDPSLRVDKILGIFNCLSCGFKGNIFYYFGEKFNKLDVKKEQLKQKIEKIRSDSIGLKVPLESVSPEFPYRVSLETLKEFEAFRNAEPDFLGRIVFPIRDISGRIKCFVGRAEDRFETPKYKIVPAGSSTPLFPLHKVIPYEGRVILVEGLFDLLNLYDNNFRNAICAFGTRKITKDKLILLKMLNISGIDIMFDPDDAGQTAAEEVKELAEELFFDVRNINLRDCDPGELTPNRAAKLKERLYG